MQGEQHPARVQLREAREETIEQLSQSFARDELSLDEFEERVNRAFAATDDHEVRSLVSDLSVPPVQISSPLTLRNGRRTNPEVAAVPARALAVVSTPPTMLAIFGNIERRGPFALIPRSKAVAVFGNVEIDLRDAVINEGVTELEVRAVFGNVEIIVPPTLAVEAHGVGIFGNFETFERVPRDPGGSPVLRITGKAVFGNVEVLTQIRRKRV